MHQVRYFLAVARHLNFTRAADEMRVAQPSLTRAIQKLEVELEGPLFRRERANTHLTELGRMMLPHLAATHAAAESARSQARSLKSADAGALSLGLCIGIDIGQHTHLVTETTQKLGGLALTIEVASSASVERRLLGGEFDAAVLVENAGMNDRFDLHRIFEDELVVAFAEGHWFAHQPHVCLDALDGEPLVGRVDSTIDEEMARIMEARGLSMHVRHRSNDLRWIAAFVQQGLGCAVLPRAAALAHGMTFRPLEDVTLTCRVVLATVAGRRHPQALATLLRQIRDASRSTIQQ